ncbi:MAG: hypothetical protein Q8Q09_05195 [Deltaproteobacteria bacterium]|nr:hypothetical protein [Deltaproteobacteria bacterium]
MRAPLLISLLLTASMFGCAPPPMPTNGRLAWSFGCDTTVMGQTECGAAPSELIEGIARRTPPPTLDTFCAIDPAGGGFNFRVRLLQGDAPQQTGLALCGSITGGAGMATNSRVDAYFGAAKIEGVPQGGAMGGCDVQIDSVDASTIRGQFRCRGVRDNALLWRVVGGVPPSSVNGTTRPDWAEFAFQNCTRGAGVCR